MDCTQTEWLSNKEYLELFHKKVVSQRIPLSGSIDLTWKCNLNCAHCYIKRSANTQQNARRELNTSQWINIIDEVTDAGCISFLITGGEPLIRKDFAEIYTHAKTNGLLVTIFTNGTLINKDILELFKDLPPRTVEITLYGATPETYEKITGSREAFDQCMHGIHQLLEANIQTKLKTILMSFNFKEFHAIMKIADDLNLDFRFDADIFPGLGGNMDPLNVRINPREAVEIEFSVKKRHEQWFELFNRMDNISIPDTLYNCGTGCSTFHIDPYGNLQPCLMVNSLTYNILKGSFFKGWHNVIPGIKEKKASKDFKCRTCDKIHLCGFCPPFFKMETGAEETPSEFLCEIGHCRYEKLKSIYAMESRGADHA